MSQALATPSVQTGSAVPPSGAPGAEIKVVAPTGVPAAPPKAGTPESKLFQRLGTRGKPLSGRTAEPATPAAPIPPAPERPGAAEPEPDDIAPGDEEDSEPKEPKVSPMGDEPKPGEPVPEAKKPKVNPWNLHKQEKERAAKLELELAETRKLIADPVARKTEMDRLAKAEQRAKELEDHIRFVDYEKSQEFKEKYETPYEQSWAKALADLQDITTTDANGNESKLSPSHMLELVNMSLPKAREMANELFGDFADDVMSARKSIREMFDAKAKALSDAKTNGATRMKEAAEKAQSEQAQIHESVTKNWDKWKAAVTKDEKFGKYFNTVDGDEQGNQRLAKGFALVERAFSENPMDPKHTPEQREAIIKRQAAVFNRAAGFGKAVLMATTLEAKVKALETELAKYKGSEPSTTGALITNAPAASGKPMDAMFARLKAKAK